MSITMRRLHLELLHSRHVNCEVAVINTEVVFYLRSQQGQEWACPDLARAKRRHRITRIIAIARIFREERGDHAGTTEVNPEARFDGTARKARPKLSHHGRLRRPRRE